MNASPSIELPGQTLHNVVLIWSYWPHVSWEGGIQNDAIWQEKGVNDDWSEYYGENYQDYLGAGTPAHPNGNLTADSLRLQIWWDGDQDEARGPGDDVGDPNRNSGHSEPDTTLGRFLSPQYPGFGILYADKSVSDKSNDLSQPFTTTWVAWEDRYPLTTDQAHEVWYRLPSGGYHNPSPQESGMASPWERGVIYGFVSVGPYEMSFDSEINVVLVVAVGSLSREKCSEYGREYRAGQLTDAQKNALIATGKDSLFKAAGRATRRYFLNLEQGRHPFDVPDPPPAPDLTVTAGQNSILVSWSDISQVPDFDTGIIDFAGYRLYRASNDSTGHRLNFQLIWQGTALSYEDTNVQTGVPYFYLVTAFDDGTQNWEHPGESLESSKFANRTTEKPAWVQTTSVEKDNRHVPTVFVLEQNYPNPFNPVTEIRFGVPEDASVKLKVFNVLGQRVKILLHEDKKAGYYRAMWNGTDEMNNELPNGIYIYQLSAINTHNSSVFVQSRKMLYVK